MGRKAKAKGGGPFREDLKKLMYGFGDHPEPNETSVGLLEVYVEEFIVNLVSRTARRSQRHGHNNLKLADILKVLQKDEKKFLRMSYILPTYNEAKSVKDNLVKTTEFLDAEQQKVFNFGKLA